MRKSERAGQARRELDRKFKAANLAPVRAWPRGGWIRSIRTGLGMSQEALAARLAVTKANVAGLEGSEVNQTISIGRLADVARAMDCQLVYVLLPNSSLEETVQRQAERVAASTLGYVATTMGLEDQAVEPDRRSEQLAAEATAVIDHNRQWNAR